MNHARHVVPGAPPAPLLGGPLLAGLLLGGLLLAGACDRAAPAQGAASGGEPSAVAVVRAMMEAPPEKDPARARPLAKVGRHVITTGEFLDELARQGPYVRMRFTSLERRKEFLKNLVRREVLVQEALRRGMLSDPEVVRQVKRALVGVLVDRLHKELVKLDDITDADVAAYYEKNKVMYQQPPKVRASVILLKGEAEARQVAAKARKLEGNVHAFNELLARRSADEAGRRSRGDTGFIGRDDPRVAAPLRAALFASKGLWTVVGPVKTDKGWAVAMVTGRREALNRPLALEKDRIKNRLFHERRFAAVNDYLEKLRAKAKVEVLEDNLARVKVEAKPQAPKAPPPEHGSR